VLDKGAPVTKADARQATEPLGLVAGDDVAAQFGFAGGVVGHFASKASPDTAGERFAVTFYGTRGAISIPLSAVPNAPAQILRSGAWRGGAWETIEPPPETRGQARGAANAMMVADLLAAIEGNREAACGARDGRWTLEMVTGVYQAHLAGARLAFPLRERRHPFD
jgi:predicted dehydrogenase